tara:strand:- start:509 stop:718 length:210 start_codon:yes stop_codon:yes gene_type:complete
MGAHLRRRPAEDAKHTQILHNILILFNNQYYLDFQAVPRGPQRGESRALAIGYVFEQATKKRIPPAAAP